MNLPGRIYKQPKTTPEVRFIFHKVVYSKMPFSPRDCFGKFPNFKDQYLYQGKTYLDFGLRTIKSIINIPKNEVKVYIVDNHGLNKDLLFDIIFFQPLKLIIKYHNLFIQHAACVAKGKSGVLICGESGCGKSALSFTLIKNGYKYLSDDDIILKPSRGRTGYWAIPKIIIFPQYCNSAKMEIKPLNKQKALWELMREDFTIFRKS